MPALGAFGTVSGKDVMPKCIWIRLSETGNLKIPVAGPMAQRAQSLSQLETRFSAICLDALDVSLKQRSHFCPLVIGEHRYRQFTSPAIVGLRHGAGSWPNVKARAPLPAAAHVDHGGWVVVKENHRN